MIAKSSKIRRLKRVRGKLAINQNTPRLSVFRSNQHLWAQIIDDKQNKTLLTASTKSLKDSKATKIEKAAILGKNIAVLALEKKITKIRFDRGLYRYHGRVKALADAARAAGLKF